MCAAPRPLVLLGDAESTPRAAGLALLAPLSCLVIRASLRGPGLFVMQLRDDCSGLTQATLAALPFDGALYLLVYLHCI